MLGSVLGLASGLSVFPALVAGLDGLPAPVPGIPVWDQYVDFLKFVLDDLLAESLNNGALAIIVFTVAIKTLLLPLTVQSIRSSKAMQELQPKIGELRKKYGKDRQELSMRTMELYRQYHINPMAGCLPILIQIPIFFGVYSAINSLSNSGVGHFADGFLWLPDLGEADPFKILPFVAAAFQFVQTKMMRPQNQGKITDPQQAMMNTMMNFMPLMVIVFGWNFASGAVLYWAVQSVYSVVQQWFITGWGSMKDWVPALPEMPEHRRLGYRKPRDLDEVVVVSGEPPQAKGFAGWMQRKMEESQRLAEERRAAQKASRGGSRADAGATTGSGSGYAARRNSRGGYQSKVDRTASDGADVAAGASTTGRPAKRSGARPTAKRSGGKSTAAATANGRGDAQAGTGSGNGVARTATRDKGASAPANGAEPLPAPRKGRSGRKPNDRAPQ